MQPCSMAAPFSGCTALSRPALVRMSGRKLLSGAASEAPRRTPPEDQGRVEKLIVAELPRPGGRPDYDNVVFWHNRHDFGPLSNWRKRHIDHNFRAFSQC